MSENNIQNKNEAKSKNPIVKYLTWAAVAIIVIVKGALVIKSLNKNDSTPADPQAEAACHSSIQGAIDIIKPTNLQIQTLQENYKKLGTNDIDTNFLFFPINEVYAKSNSEGLPNLNKILTTKINPSKYNECISWGEQLKAQYLKIQTLVTSLNSAIVNTQKSAPAFQKALDCQTKEECDAITETLFVNEAGQKQYTAFNADITSLNLLNKISSPTISTIDNKNCIDAAKKSINLYSKAIELNKTTREALFGAGLKNTPIEALFLQSNQYNKAYDRKWLSVAEKISQNYVKDSESFNCVQVFALNDKIVESGIKTNQNMLDNIGKIQQAIAQKKAGFTCKDLSVKNMTCVQEAFSLMDIVNSFDPVPEGHKEAYYKDIIEFANPYKNMQTNTKR